MELKPEVLWHWAHYRNMLLMQLISKSTWNCI